MFSGEVLEFQNPFIRKTIYELIPVNETPEHHLKVAQHIERRYKEDLRPYFSR